MRIAAIATILAVSPATVGSAFSQIVKVAPYYNAGAGVQAVASYSAADTSIDWIAVGQTDRMLIPRTDAIRKVRLYIADRSNISNLYVGVCRWSAGSVWNVVQWTPALAPVFADEVNTYTLATPLSAAKYDVMCGRIEWSIPHAPHLAALSAVSLPQFPGDGNTVQPEDCYYQLNAAMPGSFDTAAMALIPNNACPVIEAWMARPDLVAIGDSIIQKNDSNADGGVALTRPLSSAVGQSGISVPYYVALENPGLTYQNMGWGGQTTAQIAARFSQDALTLEPSWIILDGGVNDVYANCPAVSGCTPAQISAIENALAAMMSAAHSAGVKLLIMLIGPWSGNGADATDAQMLSIDTINANTISIAPAYGASVIDQRCVVGEFRPGGPAGNCWNIQPQYLDGDGLGVHLNQAGEQRVADLINLNLNSFRYSGGIALSGTSFQK